MIAITAAAAALVVVVPCEVAAAAGISSSLSRAHRLPGARRGAPPGGHPALETYWSAALEDNAALLRPPPAPQAALYAAVQSDGFAVGAGDRPAPVGTVPLWTFWSDRFNDSMQVASERGIAFVTAHNYTRVRQEGWVYASERPGTVPLRQFYFAPRTDHYLVAADGAAATAVASGYSEVWVEGWTVKSQFYPGTWSPWPNATPPGPAAGGAMPWPASTALSRLELDWGSATGNDDVTGADTFFPSWGADGRLFTTFADGRVRTSADAARGGGNAGWVAACCDERNKRACGSVAHAGFAAFSGNDPLNLTCDVVGTVDAAAGPFYQGRYPSASLSHNGTWYVGTHMLTTAFAPFDWDVMGPLVSIRTSVDGGATWDEPVERQAARNQSVFGEFAVTWSRAHKVRFGAPHFVDFGQNMEHSPDGRAYIVGHGSSETNAIRESWMSGDEVYLARTAGAPDPATVNDGGQWEFFAGRDASGAAVWVRGDVSAARPVVTWLNRTGVVTVTYVATVKRYLMCVSTPYDFDSYVLESADITGPYSAVAYLNSFGPEAYCLNVPSKFVAPAVVNGTLELWLSYSANFACGAAGHCSSGPNAPFSGYRWVLQKLRVAVGGDAAAAVAQAAPPPLAAKGAGGAAHADAAAGVAGVAAAAPRSRRPGGRGRQNSAAVPPGQNTSTYGAIVNTSFALLESHLVAGERWGLPFHFYRPALEKYSASQWLWDSGSHQIVWSRRNAINAALDLRTMLQMQEPDGFVPEMIFWNSTLPPAPLRYRDGKTSGITQMPVLAFSLRAIHDAASRGGGGGGKDLLAEFLPALARYWRWWGAERDVRGKGLVSVLHGWESGLDASPLYDAAYALRAPVGPVTERLYRMLYPKFAELEASYATLYGWNRTRIISRARAPPGGGVVDTWFFVEDVGVNAVYIRGWEVLGALAAVAGDGALEGECNATAARLTAALLRECWDPALKRFVSWWRTPDCKGWATTDVEAVQSLFPLMLALPAAQRDAVVANLLNESKFWSPFPLPSVAMDASTFTPGFSETADLMWRGPSWAFPNWFVLEGLLRHAAEGAPALRGVAGELVRRWAGAVEASGVWEMWNPLTGEGAGVPGLGMSTLVVDALARVGAIVDAGGGA